MRIAGGTAKRITKRIINFILVGVRLCFPGRRADLSGHLPHRLLCRLQPAGRGAAGLLLLLDLIGA